MEDAWAVFLAAAVALAGAIYGFVQREITVALVAAAVALLAIAAAVKAV